MLKQINTDDSDVAGCYEPVASSRTTLQNEIITPDQAKHSRGYNFPRGIDFPNPLLRIPIDVTAL
jgi:hypothetical protein